MKLVPCAYCGRSHCPGAPRFKGICDVRPQTNDNWYLVVWEHDSMTCKMYSQHRSIGAAQEHIQCVKDNYPNAKVELFECIPKEIS